AALTTGSLLLDGVVARGHLHSYLSKWRHVRTVLNGEALRQMGFEEGPEMGRVLAALRDARLDGLVSTRAEEIVLAEETLCRRSDG
ncbi:hypothetical protein ACFLUT_03805, partial [Chloroflexota bacterium]